MRMLQIQKRIHFVKKVFCFRMSKSLTFVYQLFRSGKMFDHIEKTDGVVGAM